MGQRPLTQRPDALDHHPDPADHQQRGCRVLDQKRHDGKAHREAVGADGLHDPRLKHPSGLEHQELTSSN